MFEALESCLAHGSKAAAARPLAMRLLLRSAYVAATVTAAVLLPFIGDLMGIVRMQPPVPSPAVSFKAQCILFGNRKLYVDMQHHSLGAKCLMQSV